MNGNKSLLHGVQTDLSLANRHTANKSLLHGVQTDLSLANDGLTGVAEGVAPTATPIIEKVLLLSDWHNKRPVFFFLKVFFVGSSARGCTRGSLRSLRSRGSNAHIGILYEKKNTSRPGNTW